MTTAIHRRLDLLQSQRDPTVIGRVPSGYWVLGEVQVRLGYSLLIPDPIVSDLNALSADARAQFLLDWGRLSQVTQTALGALRVNLAIFGNVEPALHAHLIPRFATEPPLQQPLQPWALDWEHAPRFDPHTHQSLIAQLRQQAVRELAGDFCW